MNDLLFKAENHIFSYRVGGILLHKNKLLLQKVPGEDGYAVIGGHVAFGEVTEETLKREFKEELKADIKIDRLAAIGENFFLWDRRPCQQICLYYWVSIKNESQMPMDGCFNVLDELGNERVDLIMSWIPIENIDTITVYPPQIKELIINRDNEVKHFIYNEL